MKKRILMLLLAACLMANLLPVGAFAGEVAETTEAVEETTEETTEATETTEAAADPDAKSGTCGDGLTWSLEGNTLTISGSGEMDDGAPWAAHDRKIRKLVLTGGVTRVGAKSFYGYNRLESIDFGNALVEIGEQAFYGCTGLTVIHLPATFRTFGAECFRECTYLEKVYCDGGMPRFNSSCLWTGNYIAVYHPTNNIWPQEAVSQLVSNFGGRLGIMMGNYDESVLADGNEETETEAPETEPEETQAPTEAPTEATTEPSETEPVETEAAAVVYITAPAEETTEPVTEPQTRPTEEETEPEAVTEPQENEDLGGKSWIGIVMIAGVITFLLSGTMIFRSASRKGGRYGR